MTHSERGSLARLLDTVCLHPVGRRSPYTNVELALIVQAQGGEITHTYISQLRKGDKDNPSSRTIEGLAEALDVHPAYFVGGRRDRPPEERPRWEAERLRYLFAAVHPRGRGPYSPEEAAAAIRQDGRYGGISASYIRELLAGTSDNPRLKHIFGLAGYFGAPPAYFYDAELAARVDTQLKTRLAMEKLGADNVILRAAEHLPSPEIRRKILAELAKALCPERSTEEVVAEAVRPENVEPRDAAEE
ncbi:helix-turn-helix domain-containing protein [Amycolatopsis sp. NPDC049868]|uniref:helix-turn-helix domain-containing protein n=1 Tax=Amycolatopsis sp. NPDC049868 TaxID=3363934 RepID=UPI0037B32886